MEAVQAPRETSDAEEMAALQGIQAQYMEASEQPSFPKDLPGVEDARYLLPESTDPQWIPAYKLFDDAKGVFGVVVWIPRGQWDQGGPNALMNQTRETGGRRFTLVKPGRMQDENKIECFIGICRKKLPDGAMLVKHVRNYHAEESLSFKKELDEIDQATVAQDSRFQRTRAALGITPQADDAKTSAPPLFWCTRDGCDRFFDSEDGRNKHAGHPHKEA